MKQTIQRVLLGAGAALSIVVLDAHAALAQLVQSESDAQPGVTETTQLVTSSTEVRRAVIGLIMVAVVTAVLGIMYWMKTGQQARDRFDRRYGGRHGSPQPATTLQDAIVLDEPQVRQRWSAPTQHAPPSEPPSHFPDAGHPGGQAPVHRQASPAGVGAARRQGLSQQAMARRHH